MGIFSRKKSSSTSSEIDSVKTMLDLFYSSAGMRLDKLPRHLLLRSLFFSYGVIDAYCQVSKLTSDNAIQVFKGIDNFILSKFGHGILPIVDSNIQTIAFQDKYLLNLTSVGGASYNDFASGDPKKGSMSLRRFGSLLGMWTSIMESENESKIIELIAQKSDA